MSPVLLSIPASLLISLFSFIGAVAFVLNREALDRVQTLLIGFAAGSLIGGAFIHLLPEAIEKNGGKVEPLFLIFLGGFCFFFLMERFMYWRHCHKADCEVHPFGYLNLAGGAIHNITDGFIIAGGFSMGVKTGLVTSLAIVAHKIPHELGDIAVFLSSGFSRRKAVLYNYFSDLFIVVGAVLGVLMLNRIGSLNVVLSSASAGGFVYVAASDLIPMIHQNRDQRMSNRAFVFFVGGLLLMFASRMWLS